MYKETIEKLVAAGLNPGKTIAETKKNTGKALVGVFPIRTPEEIVYAAGCVPIGMWGGHTEITQADKYLQGFCCSIMRINVEHALRGVYNDVKAVIIPTFCDTMKCIVENWKLALPQIPTIAFAYPQHHKLPAGMEFTIDEIKRVKHELELALHKIITKEQVEEAFCVYEEWRKTMREFTELAAEHPEIITAKKRYAIMKAGCYMDKAVYTEMVKEINEGLKAEAASAFKGVRTIVTGIMVEPTDVLDVFEENGIAIVGDDLAIGSRLWRTPAREEVEDVYQKMAYMIHDIEGDTFFFEPEKKKGGMLIEMTKEKKADAAIVMMMKFCDPEEYDYPIYKAELEKAGIPQLYLEFDQQLSTFEQIRTRVQSFTEMLL